MTDHLKKNAILVEALESSLRSGGNALSAVPGLLKRILAEEAWREFVTQRGELVRYERFIDFVTTPPLKGLGASIELIRRIVADDPEALDLLDRAVKAGSRQGERTDIVNNVNDVTVTRPQGNSRERALRKLRKDAPELHAEVIAGRLSTHAAMVKAGFRPKTVSIRLDDPASAIRTLRAKASPEFIAELRKLLDEDA